MSAVIYRIHNKAFNAVNVRSTPGGKAQQLLNEELENTDQNARKSLSDPKVGATSYGGGGGGSRRGAPPNAQKVLAYWQEKIKAKVCLD